jgi:hypothetical protein
MLVPRTFFLKSRTLARVTERKNSPPGFGLRAALCRFCCPQASPVAFASGNFPIPCFCFSSPLPPFPSVKFLLSSVGPRNFLPKRPPQSKTLARVTERKNSPPGFGLRAALCRFVARKHLPWRFPPGTFQSRVSASPLRYLCFLLLKILFPAVVPELSC